MDYAIHHDQHNLRFETTVEGKTAHIIYRHFNGGIMITHTLVPVELEGRGIAAALTKAVVDYGVEHSIRVVPVCSYAVAYFKRHHIDWEEI